MPASPKRQLDELNEDLAYQRVFWTAERFAWGVFALIVVAAFLGFTGGGGLLAHGRAETPDAVIEYPRFSRWQAADYLTIRLAPSIGDRAVVEIDRRFAEAFDITSVLPEPENVTATPAGVRYEFATEDGGEIVFHVRASRPSFLSNAAISVGGARANTWSLILP